MPVITAHRASPARALAGRAAGTSLHIWAVDQASAFAGFAGVAVRPFSYGTGTGPDGRRGCGSKGGAQATGYATAQYVHTTPVAHPSLTQLLHGLSNGGPTAPSTGPPPRRGGVVGDDGGRGEPLGRGACLRPTASRPVRRTAAPGLPTRDRRRAGVRCPDTAHPDDQPAEGPLRSQAHPPRLRAS